jgi:putative acetyltransferase
MNWVSCRECRAFIHAEYQIPSALALWKLTGRPGMNILIEAMTIDHYDEVIDLWKKSENIGLSRADQREKIKAYLDRNPGMSFVAKDNGVIVGAALCGHDGRRGYLHHLAVAKSHQKKGTGRKLTERCLESLGNAGIKKCHLFVFQKNKEGKAFWEKIGWTPRTDIQVVCKELKE